MSFHDKFKRKLKRYTPEGYEIKDFAALNETLAEFNRVRNEAHKRLPETNWYPPLSQRKQRKPTIVERLTEPFRHEEPAPKETPKQPTVKEFVSIVEPPDRGLGGLVRNVFRRVKK